MGMQQRMCWTNAHIADECIALRDAWIVAVNGSKPRNWNSTDHIMNLKTWSVSLPKNSIRANKDIPANTKLSDPEEEEATEEQVSNREEDCSGHIEQNGTYQLKKKISLDPMNVCASLAFNYCVHLCF